jgi:alpha-glutamyl/putrescinyl thymine pyrophosphorylase clade 1
MAGLKTTIVQLSAVIPTQVYDTYWRFAAERQAIFFKRITGATSPWTRDPILMLYKFTNAYRASDRVSQYLIKNVIYRGEQSPEEVFFRTLLFKLFNRIDTWELLENDLGEIRYSAYSFRQYDKVLTRAKAQGRRIYSAAYIMPSGSSAFGHSIKHRNHLNLLENMMKDNVPLRIQEMRTMREAFELLRSYPTIGNFLAYQFVTDLNYSELCNFSEMTFVVPGPGALDGIRKCFHSLGGLNETEIIRVMAERQEEEFSRLDLNFQSLWGRPLQLIDCQNLFCEVDKYARVAHPEVVGISGRKRIKQNYQANKKPIDYWYPPKWGLNNKLEASMKEYGASF